MPGTLPDPHFGVGNQQLPQRYLAVIIEMACALAGRVPGWLRCGTSRKGRSWARTAGTILFGLDAIGLLGTLGRAGIPVAKTFGVLVWLIGPPHLHKHGCSQLR
jgi:hypothetical protein